MNSQQTIIVDSNERIPSPSELTSEWVIYGKETCKFCDKTKELVKENKIQNVVYIDVTNKSADIKQELKNHLNGYATFPMVFNNKLLIGGYNEFVSVCNI